MTGRRTSAAALGAALGLGLASGLLVPGWLAGTVPARLDLADFFWPMKGYTALRWRLGGVPLWNPLSGCGEPWLAQLQSGVFYPGDLPFLLAWPLAPLVAIALHLVIAASGMAAWLDDLETSRAGALAGAAVFAGGGAFVSLVPVYNNACTAAYLPWIFLGARRLLRGEGAAGLAFPAALAFLGGEPGLAVSGALAGALVALFTRDEGEFGKGGSAARAWARLAASLTLAAGLSAVAACPFVEHILRTGRLSSVTRAEAMSRPVGLGDLGGLVVPHMAAEAHQGGSDRSGYLVTLAVGPLAIVFAAGCVAGFPGRRRLLAGLAVIGGLSLLVSLGAKGLLAPVLYDLGPLRALRFPARWFVFTHLALSAAVGAGLDGWLYGRFGPRRRQDAAEAAARPGDASLRGEEYEEPLSFWPARLTAGVLIALGALLALAGFRSGTVDRERLALVMAALVVGLGAVAASRLGGWLSRGTASALAVLALVAPLPWLSADALEGAPADLLRARPEILAGLPEGAPGRVFVAVHDPRLLQTWAMPGGAGWSLDAVRRAHKALAGYGNLTAGVATANSASPIANPRLVRLLGAALVGGAPARILGLADVRNIVTPFTAAIPGTRLERRTDGMARYAVASPAGRVFFARRVEVADDDAVFAVVRRPDFDPEAVAYVSEVAGPLPPGEGGQRHALANVAKDLPEETEVSLDVSRPVFLVVTRSFDPGWKARVDGAPARLVRTDLAFMGLVVPAGQHRVELRYEPFSFRAGAWVSGASWVLLGVLWLAGGPKRRK